MQRFASISDVIASYPSRFKPEKAAGIEGVVQLRLTGAGGGDYHLALHDQQLTVSEGVHPEPTMTATAAAADWLALNNGEVAPMALLMQGKLTFKGSLPLAMKFRSLFETAI